MKVLVPHPFNVWHGETDIASYETDSGEFNSGTGLERMFDDESSGTIWQSSPSAFTKVKTLTITFINPIYFQSLKIRKHTNHDAFDEAKNAYSNICLVLNNDITNQLCTDQPKGFSHSDDENVQWILPTDIVTKVQLVFRYIETAYSDYNGNAMIQDLKIFYYEISEAKFSGQCLKDYVDSNGESILKNKRLDKAQDLTIEKCLDVCKFEKYAGLGSGHNCFCGDELSRIDILADGDCTGKCTGDQTQTCGGYQKWSVYSIESPQKFTGECITAYLENDGGPVIALYETFATSLTLEICLDKCKNFKYASLGNGKNCHCIENLTKLDFLPESECNTPCIGDSSDNKCGALMKWSVYSIEEPKPFTGQCIKDYYHGVQILGEGVAVDGLTVEKCLESCKNHKYAGVQNGNACHCAKEFAP